MEKKTIGSFIATLRKANGLTQRQLAEKLCVSDKAVSRWERDETMPDLSLIPVIAEIFGVTTDELLRGQRKDPETPTANWEAQTQLQRRRLVKNAKAQYTTRSMICAGIAVIGLIAALICNHGFLKSYLGFGLGGAFCALALVLQGVFTVQAHSAVDDEDLDAGLLKGCYTHFFKLCAAVITLIALILAFISPMALLGDPYWGIDNLFTFENIQLCVITVAVCLVLAWLAAVYLSKKGVLEISQRTLKLNNLRLCCIALAMVLLLLFLFILSFLTNELPELLMTGTTFQNWEDFKSHMETPSAYDLEANQNDDGTYVQEAFITNESGNGIYDVGDYEADEQTEMIYNNEGTLLCSYVQRNHNIYRISFNEASSDFLPVTVYSYDDYAAAQVIPGVSLYLPVLLIGIGIFIYYKKKAAQIQ